MRETMGVYRGRRVDNGEFIEGDLIHGASGKAFISYDEAYIVNDCCGEHIETDRFLEVDPATVGEWTGLCDKNGKRIFEGDVVKCHDVTLRADKLHHEFVGTVGFDTASFMIDDGAACHYRWMDYEIEIVGEITGTTIWDKGDGNANHI